MRGPEAKSTWTVGAAGAEVAQEVPWGPAQARLSEVGQRRQAGDYLGGSVWEPLTHSLWPSQLHSTSATDHAALPTSPAARHQHTSRRPVPTQTSCFPSGMHGCPCSMTAGVVGPGTPWPSGHPSGPAGACSGLAV